MKHSTVKKSALKKPGVRDEYAALGQEFERLRRVLSARKQLELSGTKARATSLKTNKTRP